jgi:GT2 family glycosyltransferase
MKVFHMIPWNTDKNIGRAYNEMMFLVGDNDWVCFIDGDAVHTSHFFGKRIEDVITSNPEYSMFTCMTNRVGRPYQIPANVDTKSNDQKYHREFGDLLWDKNGVNVLNITDRPNLSGVMILIKKTMWETVGGFKEKKMITIDGDMHQRVKCSEGKVGLMRGIYVQHWYRGGNAQNKKHLQ